jgi:hypothetical protein
MKITSGGIEFHGPTGSGYSNQTWTHDNTNHWNNF